MINIDAILVRHKLASDREMMATKTVKKGTSQMTTSIDTMTEDVIDHGTETVAHLMIVEEILMTTEGGIRMTVHQTKAVL